MVNTELRVGLYNVRGVHPTPHSGPKLPSFLQWGKEVGCSLLALTETHTTNTYNPFTTPTFQKNYQVASSSCQTKTAGVALIALDKRATITPTISALDGRLLVATVTLPSLPNPIMVAVIYAPDSGKSTAKRRKFFNKCQRLIPREVDILLGDFNVTLRPEDSSAPRAPLAVLNAVEDLLSHLGLADIASEGAAHTFHWDKKKPKPGSARLDRAYAPVESFMAPTQLPTQDPGLSDHSPVLCSLLTGLTSKASPLPRLRVEGIIPGQLHAYNMIVDELPPNPTVGQWGAMKRQLLAVSKAFHKATRPQQPPPSSVSPEELSVAVEKAARIARIPVDMARELPGPILSSWVKGSKARAAIKTLRHLEPDLPQYEPRAIMSILEEYWSSIFTTKAVVTGSLHNLLPKATWSSLQRRFTLEEVSAALCKTKKGSAPGPDGIPYEFYKAFPQLLEKLTNLFNHCYQDGVIPSSWRTAILYTLPKEGKDTTLVSNYRPIAFLCTDFKLMTSILASRLQGELLRLNYFPRHQTGFLQGRSVYEAIFKVAHWTMDLAGTTILLDFEKAYDRVQHSWLWNCLEAAGLPLIFRSFLAVCLTGCTLQILANNSLSRRLSISSGVRQGDPLSPLLFNFAIEPLLLSLEKVGARAQGHADDTAINISNQQQLTGALQAISQYEQASGMCLNKDKSVILGPLKKPWLELSGFKAKPHGDRYLGILLGPKGELLKKNLFLGKEEEGSSSGAPLIF